MNINKYKTIEVTEEEIDYLITGLGWYLSEVNLDSRESAKVHKLRDYLVNDLKSTPSP